MNRKRKTAFFILMAVWLLIIASYTVYKEYILHFGYSVMLKVRPVDPRDLFRGDYVILDYDINFPQKDQRIFNYYGRETEKDAIIKDGDTVYVMLIKDGQYYTGGDIYHLQRPEKGLFIKGRARTGKSWDSAYNFIIIYGIENYFVPEGQGREIERIINRDRVSAKVMLSPYGDAAVKNLYIDDKKVDFKNKDEKIN